MSSKIVRLTITTFCFVAMIAMSAPLYAQGGGGLSENDDDPRNGGSRTTRQPAKKKFEELLKEKNLDKFRGYANEKIGDGWEIQGKYLHFDGSGGGDIITKEKYRNFELQFEWKISEGGNSGVMYRVSTGDNAPYFSGPEYQVLDNSGHADGKNELTSAGSLYGLYPPKDGRTKSLSTFNKSKIIVDGDKVVHYLNGKRVVEAEIGSDDWNKRLGESKFKDWEKYAKNRSGHIAFQDHGNEVWYRNIRIKRLPDGDDGDDEELASSGLDRGPSGKKSDKPAANPNPRLSRFANQKKGMKDALVGATGNKKKKKDEDKEGDDNEDDK